VLLSGPNERENAVRDDRQQGDPSTRKPRFAVSVLEGENDPTDRSGNDREIRQLDEKQSSRLGVCDEIADIRRRAKTNNEQKQAPREGGCRRSYLASSPPMSADLR